METNEQPRQQQVRRPPAESRLKPSLRSGLRQRVPPDVVVLLAITAAVVVANLPYVVGYADANPLGPQSGLVSAINPGRLPGARTIDPNNGFVSQALSHRAVIDWLHLELPWWNPYEGTGAPLAGEMQSAALFPPTLLTILSNGQLYERMLLEILAGFATYLLLRRLSVNRLASAAGGIIFALNGTFAWLNHAPVNPIAFLPLLLLGIEQAYAASIAGRRGGWWLIAWAGALSCYAGFPEVAYIDGLLALGWFVWRACCAGRTSIRSLAAKGAAGVAVGTLLSAPFLIASVNYVGKGDIGYHGTDAFGKLHIITKAWPQVLLPYVFGPIFTNGDPNLLLQIWGPVGGYLSASLLLFALIGLFSKGRRGLRITLLIWLVLSFARIFGEPPLLGKVFVFLPGMSRMAVFRYLYPSVELAVAVLAALGINELARAHYSRRRVAWVALASLGVVILASVAARPLVHELTSGEQKYFKAAVVWGVATVLVGAGVALLSDVRARVWLATLLVAGEAALLFAVPAGSAPRTVKIDLAPVEFLQQHVGRSRFFTLGPLQPNYGSYFGIGSVNIDDIPIPDIFSRYVNARLDRAVDPVMFVGNFSGRPPGAPSTQKELVRNLEGYRAAGVSYVLAPPGTSLPQRPGMFKLVFRSPSTWIYHLDGAAPYFTATNGDCAVRAESRESVQLSCPHPTTLIRRETAFPGWKAKVDGRPARLHRVDDLFQAVDVGGGTHRITFGYAPPYIGWGFAAFAAGCAWLLFAGIARRPRRPVSQTEVDGDVRAGELVGKSATRSR